MTAAARRLAAVAGATVVAGAVAIWVVVQQQQDVEQPDAVSRALASAVLLAAPGIVGWIGALMGRRTVVIAAGVACLFQSVISFSGVTFLFLIPAVGFLRAGVGGREGSVEEGQIRVGRVILAVALSVPIALVVARFLGILGILALVVVAGIASSQPRGNAGPQLTATGAIRGVAVVLLIVGAWIASFVLAETACWVGHGTPGGPISWERIPPTDPLTLDGDEVASVCADGTITPAGVATAGGLLVLALAAAALPIGRGYLGDTAG